MTTALIAEDEPLLAAEIREELERLWPELDVCAIVHDGHAALREIEPASTAGAVPRRADAGTHGDRRRARDWHARARRLHHCV